MVTLLLYYAFLPLFAGALVIALIKRFGAKEVAPAVRALLESRPMPPRTFRVARVDESKGPAVLVGDFETLDEAVDAAYKGRQELRSRGGRASFLVIDDSGDTLQEVEA